MFTQILFTRLVTKKQSPTDTVDEIKVKVARIVDAAHKSLHITIDERITTLLKIGILIEADKEAHDIKVGEDHYKINSVLGSISAYYLTLTEWPLFVEA